MITHNHVLLVITNNPDIIIIITVYIMELWDLPWASPRDSDSGFLTYAVNLESGIEDWNGPEPKR